MTFKTPQEERKYSRGPPTNGNAVCLIHSNLNSNTTYYFCVRAYNAAGESEMSEIINCMTLSDTDSTLTGRHVMFLLKISIPNFQSCLSLHGSLIVWNILLNSVDLNVLFIHIIVYSYFRLVKIVRIPTSQ